MLLIAQFNVPFYFGGTSLLILVGVAIDFMGQVESLLIVARRLRGPDGENPHPGQGLSMKKFRGVYRRERAGDCPSAQGQRHDRGHS